MHLNFRKSAGASAPERPNVPTHGLRPRNPPKIHPQIFRRPAIYRSVSKAWCFLRVLGTTCEPTLDQVTVASGAVSRFQRWLLSVAKISVVLPNLLLTVAADARHDRYMLDVVSSRFKPAPSLINCACLYKCYSVLLCSWLGGAVGLLWAYKAIQGLQF